VWHCVHQKAEIPHRIMRYIVISALSCICIVVLFVLLTLFVTAEYHGGCNCHYASNCRSAVIFNIYYYALMAPHRTNTTNRAAPNILFVLSSNGIVGQIMYSHLLNASFCLWNQLPFSLRQSHSLILFFPYFFVSGPCARLSWLSPQLLSAR